MSKLIDWWTDDRAIGFDKTRRIFSWKKDEQVYGTWAKYKGVQCVPVSKCSEFLLFQGPLLSSCTCARPKPKTIEKHVHLIVFAVAFFWNRVCHFNINENTRPESTYAHQQWTWPKCMARYLKKSATRALRATPIQYDFAICLAQKKKVQIVRLCVKPSFFFLHTIVKDLHFFFFFFV